MIQFDVIFSTLLFSKLQGDYMEQFKLVEYYLLHNFFYFHSKVVECWVKKKETENANQMGSIALDYNRNMAGLPQMC